MVPKFVATVSEFRFDGPEYGTAVKKAVSFSLRAASRAFLLVIAARVRVKTGFLRGAFGTLEDRVGYVVEHKIVPKSDPRVRKSKIASRIADLQKQLNAVPSRMQRRKTAEASLPKGKKREGATKILAKQEKTIAKKKSTITELKKKVRLLREIQALSLFANTEGLAQGEYYYPTPVGRMGRKRGIRRGNPVLKTPLSGRPFATPVASIIRPSTGDAGFMFTYAVDIRYYPYNDVNWQSWDSAVAAFMTAFIDTVRDKYPHFTDFLFTTQVTSATSAGITSGGIRYVDSLGPIDASERIGPS
jgi:hypothetical protein